MLLYLPFSSPATQLRFNMRKMIIGGLSVYFLLVFAVPYFSQPKEVENIIAAARSSEDSIRLYVHKYKEMAIMEMHRAGIPASITLAQGILESRYGTSELAVFANNHFGIKMGADWNGDKYYVYSNEWNGHLQRLEKRISCFRAYPSATESYSHHSDFVSQRAHYKSLFKLPPTDYAAWAEGLKKAGYATDPEYAAKLISLIKRFKLEQYDRVPKYQIINTPRFLR
jgi:flagellum-specific peptidoglycan hydrolase FlgJ